MALRQTLAAAEGWVTSQKSGGFDSEDDRKAFTVTYASASIAHRISDFEAIGTVSVTTAPTTTGRIVNYTISGLSVFNKIATGVMGQATVNGASVNKHLVNEDLWPQVYSQPDTYIVHEGSHGKFVIHDGILKHFRCPADDGTGTDRTLDFENYQKLLERHMGYSYVAAKGTQQEGDTALATYNTFLGNLT